MKKKMIHRSHKKVLLIGWDAADWKVIHPLLDAGMMPNLEKLINSGVMGNLATLFPDLSPMLWTSIATGKRPFKHGVLGFTEPDPHSAGIRPITNLSRKTKAIWNILCQNDRKCNVIGWWPSHPAEPINGVMVSNHYQRAKAPFGEPWPMTPGSVYPQRLIRNLAELRMHPQELDVRLVMNFIPCLPEIDQEKDRRVEGIAKIIADSLNISRAATAVMRHEPWDFTAVYFEGIDHYSHGFMQFHPPHLEWVDEMDFELYKNVVASGYIHHDVLLGHLLDLTDDDTLVILVSDHGFHSDHLRPRHVPVEPAGPAVQHRHYGIFVMKGPGVLEDETIHGATLLDICPTILMSLGLPVGNDMDGKPLINAYKTPPKFNTIPSWDDVKGNDGRHPQDMRIDPVETREAVKQLAALGYIDEPSEDLETAEKETVRELQFNLARTYMDANRPLEAVPILKELYQKWPDEHRFGIQLISCLDALDRIQEARPILDELFLRREQNSIEASERLKELSQKYKDAENEPSRKEQWEIRKLRARIGINPYAMEYLMGSLHFAEGNMKEALHHFQLAEKSDPSQPRIYEKLGKVLLKLKRPGQAETMFNKALELDPEDASAYLGIGNTYLARGQFDKAVAAVLDSVGLLYHNPRAHFLLGLALDHNGQTEQAVLALKVAVTQNPNMVNAHDLLADIFDTRLLDPDEARHWREQAELARQRVTAIRDDSFSLPLPKKQAAETVTSSCRTNNTPLTTETVVNPSEMITIVTGLPRSGTSMMMQMLAEGGIPALTDNVRQADEDNPRGYFEFEKTASLPTDQQWIKQASGKAVKIIVQLLNFLPNDDGLIYRVVFMERDMDEVLRSQQTMLAHRNRSGADLPAEKLKRIFIEQADRAAKLLADQRIPTLYMNYNDCLVLPENAAKQINGFFGGILDEQKMAAAIDPALYRHINTPCGHQPASAV